MNDDRSEAAIACSLKSTELSDRVEVWRRLARKALREARSTAQGVHLVFAGSEETQRELEELARLESECCPFAEWRVTRTGHEVVLDVTSAGDGVMAVQAVFGCHDADRGPRVSRCGP